MSKKISEEDIQKVIEMLEDSDPEQATRENAIKVIEQMKSMAGTVVDRIDEDLKSGKVTISDDGEVKRKIDSTLVNIREATKTDLLDLSQLAQSTYTETFGHTLSKEELGKALETRSKNYFESRLDIDVLIVAEIDQNLCGFIQFGKPTYEGISFEEDDIELNKIYVDQNFRGMGIGKRLIEAMLDHEKSKVAPNLYLDVYTENEKAIGLYKKYGFEVIGKTPFKVDGKILGYDLLMKKNQ